MGLAKHDHSRRHHPVNERRRHGRHAIGPHLRSAGGDSTFDVDDVFDRDGYAV
jgi:hypothetical protein